jgi:hypothetical protein
VAGTDDATVLALPERFEWFYQREYHRVVSLGYMPPGSWSRGPGSFRRL